MRRKKIMNYDSSLIIRLSSDDEEWVKKQSYNCGISQSSYIRKMIQHFRGLSNVHKKNVK